MDGACPAHDERNCSASTSSPDSQITRWRSRSAVCPHPNRPEVNIHEAYLAAATVKVPVPIVGSIGSGKTRARNGGLANEVKSYAQRIARPTRDSSKNPQLVGNYNTARVGSALSSFSPPPPPHSLTLPHNLSWKSPPPFLDRTSRRLSAIRPELLLLPAILPGFESIRPLSINTTMDQLSV